MIRPRVSRARLAAKFLGVAAAAPALLLAACASLPPSPAGETRYRLAELLYRDDFQSGLAQWSVELEAGGRVEAKGGALEIDAPRGATVWFRHKLHGPVLIEYEATAVSEGGPNDRVSDLNTFWMATDPRSPDHILDRPRSGAFADYNRLRTYYVGLGGNTNSTSRFRRYVGDELERPLLPHHDLRATGDLLEPNRPYRIRQVAYGGLIQYWRDGRIMFELKDPQPYTHGWFALRTTQNRMRVRDLRIYRLRPARADAGPERH